MEVARLLGARAQFIQWRQKRASVLAIVEHLFQPKHPLRVAVGNALYGDPLAGCTLQADDISCRLCDKIGEAQFRKQFGGLAFMGLGWLAQIRWKCRRRFHILRGFTWMTWSIWWTSPTTREASHAACVS